MTRYKGQICYKVSSWEKSSFLLVKQRLEIPCNEKFLSVFAWFQLLLFFCYDDLVNRINQTNGGK
jgi:hypothetical protein